jgi:hypothetical protein
MADGGFVRLPDGSVVVALCLPRPDAPAAPMAIRVLVHAANRPRALTRLRNLGLRAVYLRGNASPPTPDEVSAVLHHPEGVVWRPALCGAADPWQPMTRLRAAPAPAPAPAHRAEAA